MKKYTVALKVGGVMEQPHFTYKNHQVIQASSKEDAVRTYNRRNNCSYFYGSVVAEDGKILNGDEPKIHNSFN